VRYEDLRRDPAGELARVIGGLGLSVAEEKIAAVVDAHDIQKILARRAQTAAQDNSQGESAHFVRRGAVGGWQEVLSAPSAGAIEAKSRPLMEKFGYSD
jgi:hypothetical protein